MNPPLTPFLGILTSLFLLFFAPLFPVTVNAKEILTIQNTGGILIQHGGSLSQTNLLPPPLQGGGQGEISLIFHHSDHLSGASVDTDIIGNIIALNDYYPFGDTRIETGISHNDYTFTGKERDEDTALLYYEARYYDSGIGRFISLDPWGGDITDPQSLNRYSYVRNNPLKYTDPTGKTFGEFIDGAIEGFVVGVAETVTAIKNAISNPKETANEVIQSVKNVASNPRGTASSVVSGISNVFGSISSMDDNERGFLIGGLFMGGVKKAGKVITASGKSVVIGENMEKRVGPVARRLNAETYQPVKFSEAFNQKILKKFGAEKLKEIYLKRNQRWIQKIKEEGRRIFDIGKANPSNNSPYYKMEKREIRNYKNIDKKQ